jgi:hypothetical protein
MGRAGGARGGRAVAARVLSGGVGIINFYRLAVSLAYNIKI